VAAEHVHEGDAENGTNRSHSSIGGQGGLCPRMCPDAVQCRSIRTQRQPAMYAETGLKSSIRPDLESAITLANRRLQPLGHLTATEF
jgi:hypothetical protein